MATSLTVTLDGAAVPVDVGGATVGSYTPTVTGDVSAQALAAGWSPPVVVTPPPPPATYVKGATVDCYYLTGLQDPTYAQHVASLVADGATHLCINIVVAYASAANPTWTPAANRTATDESITIAVGAARAAGLKVMLKLGHSFGDGTDLTTWTGPYAAWAPQFLAACEHYATLAETLGAAVLEFGCELDAPAENDPAMFRSVIAAVGTIFKGTLSYGATMWSVAKIVFWDALPQISVHAYPDMVGPAGRTISNTDVAALSQYLLTGAQTATGSTAYVPNLAAVAAKFNKKVLATEFGARSVVGCAYRPYAYDAAGAVSNADQAAYYQAYITTLTAQPWFAGLIVWTLGLGTSATEATDYTPVGKPAEAVFKAWVAAG